MKAQLVLILVISASLALCIGIDDGYEPTDGEDTAGGHADDPATRQVWFNYDSTRSDNDTAVFRATHVENGPWYIENMTFAVWGPSRDDERGDLATTGDQEGVWYRDQAGPENQIEVGDLIIFEPPADGFVLDFDGRLVGGNYARI